MFGQSIYYPQAANLDLSVLYANYIALRQKMAQDSIYQNSINFSSLISYAVSIDFKNFQTEFLVQQMKKKLFDGQALSNKSSQFDQCQVAEKNDEKNQKNLNSQSEKDDKLPTVQFSDLLDKSEKDQPKSKALTLDESSEKIFYDDCSIKENKTSDKKLKKFHKSEKIRQLPQIDLIDHAFISKELFSRVEIEKKRSSLLSRQVENWNEIQKSRRNEKLQLRRIKY